jgi:3-hydroxyisobutyrate dehydrogenase-like beta-hydroxyacid dehydrogenase
MERIGLVGVGRMGQAMAGRLPAAGSPPSADEPFAVG